MPLNPTATKELLNELEHFPNKKLGQNFLVDGNIVRKSIELAEIRPGDNIVEIGPGLGTLTGALNQAGATVWAVERDPALAAHMRKKATKSQHRIHLTEGDCLDAPYANLPPEQMKTDFKIVANLPYAVSTPWMEAILASALPERMVLMLQKEAGDRYAASHGSKSFGAISIFLQSAFQVKSRHVVAAQCFHPAPKVDSVLLRLDRLPNKVRYCEAARSCIRTLFTQRRKQLGSLCKKLEHAALSAWYADLQAQGVAPTIRPEALPLKYWQSIPQYFWGDHTQSCLI